MPVLAVTGAAWLAVLLGGPATRGPCSAAARRGMGAALANAPSAHTGGHVGAHQVALGVTTESAVTLTGLLSGWILMVVAMMAPLLIPALRHVRVRSLQRHRPWAMALVTLGYLLTWVAVGPLLLMLAVAPSAMAGRGRHGGPPRPRGGRVVAGVALEAAMPQPEGRTSAPRRVRPFRPPGRPALRLRPRGVVRRKLLGADAHPLGGSGLARRGHGRGVAVDVERAAGAPAAGGWRFHPPLRPLRIAGARALTVAGR